MTRTDEIIKIEWVVRANNIHHDYPMHERFNTRAQARDYMRTLRGMGAWESIKLYKSLEKTFDDKSILIGLEPSR